MADQQVERRRDRRVWDERATYKTEAVKGLVSNGILSVLAAVVLVMGVIIAKYNMLDSVAATSSSVSKGFNARKKQLDALMVKSNIQIRQAAEVLIKVDDFIELYGTTTLSDSQTLLLMRSVVAAQSIQEVREIKRVLIRCRAREADRQIAEGVEVKFDNNGIMIHSCLDSAVETQEKLKSKLKRIVERNTDAIIEVLNDYNHHKLGKLGDYIVNTYPMKLFMEEIYNICVYTQETDIDKITDKLIVYMVDVAQPDYWDDVKRGME